MKRKIPIYLFSILLLYYPVILNAQNKKFDKEDKIANKILNIQFHYTTEFAGGDIQQRFGIIHNIGIGWLFKTKKNWLFGIDASYQFGNDVKENVLYNLTNSSSVISTNAGAPAVISLGERGFNTFIKVGKIIPISKGNLNSGFVMMAGVGYLAHKININVAQNNVPSLTDDLKKGYDRLSMGFATTQFIGYYFQSKNRRINFYLGLDIIEAFTQNKRGYNYDQMSFDNGHHTDLFYGPRIGWMIPIYLTTKDQDEFYYK